MVSEHVRLAIGTDWKNFLTPQAVQRVAACLFETRCKARHVVNVDKNNEILQANWLVLRAGASMSIFKS